jgi:glycosyltransferase involved in cell wall biosynthesis
MITPRYPPNIHGGGEISCKLLVNSLRDHNIDVEVISADRIYPNTKNKELLNIRMFRYLKKKIKDYRIFHTYNMSLLPALGLLSKKFNIKSIATLNGIVYSPSLSNYIYKSINPKFYRNILLMKYIRHIKLFTTLCPYYKEKWISDGLSAKTIRIIPNMILPDFKPIKKKPHNKIRLLFVGNQAEWRGLDILVDAFKKLERDCELIVVGKGWNKYPNVTYITNANLNNMPEIYASADIFIQPYKFPVPISRSLVEALQSGVCVITSGNNYYSPIIQDMKHGILIHPLNADILYEKIKLLIENNTLRKKLSNNGKKRVYDVCNSEIITKQYIDIYEDLIK